MRYFRDNKPSFLAGNFFQRLNHNNNQRSEEVVEDYLVSDIINYPEKYQAKMKSICYWLILSLGENNSSSMDTLLFLLSNPHTKKLFNNPSEGFNIIVLAQLASALLSSLSLSKKTLGSAAKIAQMFFEIESFRILVRQNGEHLAALNRFYQNLAAENASIELHDASTLLKIKQDFFVQLMANNKDFCIFIATNPCFNSLIIQFSSTFYFPENLHLLKNFFENICQAALTKKTINNHLTDLLKNLFNIYINANKKIPKLLFSDDFFWKLLSNYSKKDKEHLTNAIIKNKLANLVMYKINKELKRAEIQTIKKIILLLKEDFFHKLMVNCRSKVQENSMRSLMLLENPVVDAELCRYKLLIKRKAQWNSMLQRLKEWFSYDYFIADPAIKGHFACGAELLQSSSKNIEKIDSQYFISKEDAKHLMFKKRARAINEQQEQWVVSHRHIAQIIVNKFYERMEDYLYNISAVHDQFEEVLFLKLVREDNDRFDPNHYVLGRFPEEMQELLADSTENIQAINAHLEAMNKNWLNIQQINKYYQNQQDMNEVDGFISLHVFFSKLLDDFDNKLTEKNRKKLTKEFFSILTDLLPTLFPERFKTDSLIDLKADDFPYINETHIEKLTTLISDAISYNTKTTSFELSKEKIRGCFENLLEQTPSMTIGKG